MGGGTPTTLNAEQLHRIFDAIEKSFDLSFLREYTVEAGRPDTVTQEKLHAIWGAGVTRISINPQTLNNNVLKEIGRRHTAEQFYDAFSLARKCGFININTDLIAGLPGDNPKSFSNTLEGIFKLSPESVTVHTLAMKRASNFVKHRRENYSGGLQSAQMVNTSIERLKEEGYRPYYLYRQSKTLGGTENTGWSKPGFEGLYNVYIMDETHTILACGAGAVTKLIHPDTEYLKRVFNYKFPYEYNSRFDDMIQRKGQVISFYETLFSKT
jgi:oxygen-independent coproporphyrinogen-3 oxidase